MCLRRQKTQIPAARRQSKPVSEPATAKVCAKTTNNNKRQEEEVVWCHWTTNSPVEECGAHRTAKWRRYWISGLGQQRRPCPRGSKGGLGPPRTTTSRSRSGVANCGLKHVVLQHRTRSLTSTRHKEQATNRSKNTHKFNQHQ